MSNQIINGTTPTIRWTLPDDISAPAIYACYMTICVQGDTSQVLLERNRSTAVLSGHTVSWTLTQAETLALPERVWIQLRYKMDTDHVYASKIQPAVVNKVIKQGAI